MESKLTYAQIVKLIPPSTNFIISEATNNRLIYTSKIRSLVHKLFKHEKNNKNYINIIKELNNLILLSKDNIKTILNINNVFIENKVNRITENRYHEWISNNIIDLIKKYKFDNNINIMDIGGGEGNILNNISNNYNIPSCNLYCIEQKEWCEKYQFKNKINYIFWDNINIDIKNNVDIVLIMVALHHMTDETINNLLLNLKKIIKKDGIIIIKEHDCNNEIIKKVIDWEHHLYHLLMNNNIDENNINSYLNESIINYKSYNQIDEIFKNNGFINELKLDREFKKFIKYDDNNPTNLYWNIYKNT